MEGSADEPVLMSLEAKARLLEHQANLLQRPCLKRQFVDLTGEPSPSPPAKQPLVHTIQSDAELALSLQQQERGRPSVDTADDEALARALQAEERSGPGVSVDADAELARRLQATEAGPGVDSDAEMARRLQATEAGPGVDSDAEMARRLQAAEARQLAGPVLDPELLRQISRRDKADSVLRELDRELESGRVPELQRMKGDSPLMMNRLRSARGGSQPGPTLVEVSFRELFWHSPYLKSAVLTSFGVDYELVRRIVRRSPAEARPGGVVICDNYDHDTCAAGYDVTRYAPFVVVLPPFFDARASSGQRARLEKGTMHPKLSILEFDGGSPETRFLRVIVASANLGDYDADINNQFWAHDFALKAPQATSSETAFALDLKRFVRALLRPLKTAPEDSTAGSLPAGWESILNKYNLSPPQGTHLILSIPGRYLYEERSEYGHLALQTHLRSGLKGRDASKLPARIEMASSSVGRLLGFYDSFFRSLRTGGADSAASGSGASSIPVSHCYPSMGQMLNIIKAKNIPINLDSVDMGMTGPSADWFLSWFPQTAFAYHDMPWAHRQHSSHHCKVIAGLTNSHELVWQYSGSHNFSGAAWGKWESGGKGSDGPEFVLMSYEIGVLFIPPEPLRAAQYALPWNTPARQYSPGTCPWSNGLIAQAARGEGPFNEAATSDVLAAAEAMLQIHRACCPLPRLLTVPVGAVSQLVQLQADQPCATLHSLPTIPASRVRTAARRRVRCSELLELVCHPDDKASSQPISVGDTGIGLALETLSVGEKVQAGEGDFELGVYRILGERFMKPPHWVVDRSRDGAVALRTVAKRPPTGVLVAVLAPAESQTRVHDNEQLLSALARCKTDIEMEFWGVVPLQPGHGQEPSHAALICHKFGITCLPALLPLSASGRSLLLDSAAHGSELARLCKTDSQLLEWISRAKRRAEGATAREKAMVDTQEMIQKGIPDLIGASAAQLIRALGVKLLLIEPEGAMKKRCNVSLKIRTTDPGQHDCFREHCLPFFKHCLLDGEKWHPLAPKIALVTDLGHQCSALQQDRSQLTEPKVINVMDRLLTRLANELEVSRATVDKNVSVHVSFLADSAPEPPEDDPRSARPDWSRSWCKPNSGMLTHALKHWGIEPHAALSVGHDVRDQQAAAGAHVRYIPWQSLFTSLNPCEHIIEPSSKSTRTVAPNSFAAGPTV